MEDRNLNGDTGSPGSAGVPASEEHKDWQKKIVLFLAGQSVSIFGSSLTQYAIIWYITLTTQSGLMMTISALCTFLPMIAVSFFAGVWADRYNRKILIIASDVLTAVSTLILALFFFFGYREMWLLFLVSGIRSIGSGIQAPAVTAMIPQIVPMEKLTKVNGFNGSIQSLIMLVSPAVSGLLLSISNIESAFFVDVFTAAIAVMIMLSLKLPIHAKAAQAQTTSYIEDLKAGLRYVLESNLIKAFFIFYAVFFFLIVPAAYLTPLMVARTFGDEVWRLTAIEVAFSAGSILGGVLIAIWGGFKNKTHTIALACSAFGVLTCALGFSTFFPIYLVIMGITGITLPVFSTPATVFFQERVDKDMQGRVFGLLQIVSTTAMPLGMVIFGPAADIVKVELLLIGSGVLLFALSVYVYFNRHFKAA